MTGFARTCAGCGVELPEQARRGRRRKWCSDRCRKVTLYSSSCVDCGATINTDGRVTNASTRCVTCAGLANPRTDDRVAKILAMVRLRRDERLTNVEIGRRLETPVATVSTEFHRMRVLGFGIPSSPHYKEPLVCHPTSLDGPGLKLARELERRGITPETLEGIA